MTTWEIIAVIGCAFFIWLCGLLGGYQHLKECLLKEGFMVDRDSSYDDGHGRYRISTRKDGQWKRIYPN